MKIKNPEERYILYKDNVERINYAYSRLYDDIMCNFQDDKDLDNLNTLLELLETVCDFANSHLKDLRRDSERWLANLSNNRKGG